jgi:hypothetical protein
MTDRNPIMRKEKGIFHKRGKATKRGSIPIYIKPLNNMVRKIEILD